MSLFFSLVRSSFTFLFDVSLYVMCSCVSGSRVWAGHMCWDCICIQELWTVFSWKLITNSLPYIAKFANEEKWCVVSATQFGLAHSLDFNPTIPRVFDVFFVPLFGLKCTAGLAHAPDVTKQQQLIECKYKKKESETRIAIVSRNKKDWKRSEIATLLDRPMTISLINAVRVCVCVLNIIFYFQLKSDIKPFSSLVYWQFSWKKKQRHISLRYAAFK